MPRIAMALTSKFRRSKIYLRLVLFDVKFSLDMEDTSLRASEGVDIPRVMAVWQRRCKVTRHLDRDRDLYHYCTSGPGTTSIASMPPNTFGWKSRNTRHIRNSHIFTTRRISLFCTRTYTTTQVQDHQ